MSDSLGDILQGRSQSSQPPEFAIMSRYISDKYGILPGLALSNNNIVIRVPNAAVAGSLRLELHQLAQIAQTKRHLIIRIQ